jgi:isochorismate synthase
METSLAEDVQKPTRPCRRTASSLCRRTAVLPPQAASAASQPAVGGDALNGEFQQQMAAAFAEARAAGIRKPVMVGAIPFDTCQPSELYIPERWEAFSRPEKQRSARYAAPLEAMEVVERREIPEQDAF